MDRALATAMVVWTPCFGLCECPGDGRVSSGGPAWASLSWHHGLPSPWLPGPGPGSSREAGPSSSGSRGGTGWNEEELRRRMQWGA